MNRIRDKHWRMTTLYKIRTKVRGFEGKAVTFKPNLTQRRNYNLIYRDKKRRIIKLKPRKKGETTGWAIDSLDEPAYEQKNYHAVTMAHTSEKSQEIFNDIVKFAWDRIPPVLRPKKKYNTKTELDFSDTRGSKYVVTNDAKGSTPNRLHITEAAYFADDEQIIEAINALPEDALGIVESTACGMGNWFEMTFNDAWAALRAGRYHPWHALFDPWFDDPNNRVSSLEGRSLRYEDEARALQEKFGLDDGQIFWWDQKKQDNRDLVYQFYPSTPEEAFLHSGRPVFDLVHLAVMKAKFARAPLRTVGGIEIWEEPDQDCTYGIGVDTAEGLEHGDRSVISVVCRETGMECAQVAGNLAPHELARKLGEVVRLYDRSGERHLAVIERNNHGHAVIAYAKEDPAISLYRRKVKDKVTEKTDLVIGWDTNEKSKAYAVSELAKALEDGGCFPQNPETYLELQYYVHGDRGKMAAMKGKHDDRVTGLFLANLACREIVTVGSTSLADYHIY